MEFAATEEVAADTSAVNIASTASIDWDIPIPLYAYARLSRHLTEPVAGIRRTRKVVRVEGRPPEVEPPQFIAGMKVVIDYLPVGETGYRVVILTERLA